MRFNFHFDQLDAQENAYFGRALEVFMPELFNTKYPTLKARSLLPIDYATAGPGARLVTYRAYTMVGIAQAIANYADDAPMADAFGAEFTSKVKDYGIAYSWSVAEVKAAALAARNSVGPIMQIDTAKAAAARRGAEVNLDNIAFGGDPTTGLIGLNNIPGANTVTAPLGVSGFSDWAHKTPDEILADLFLMENTPLVNTNEVEFATRLLVPPNIYRAAADSRVSIASDTTVLGYFLAQSQHIKDIQPWNKLIGAGAGGTNRMISYRPDIDTIRLVITEEYNELAPEARNFAFVVNAMMSVGGVICPYPLSVTYVDGV